MIDYIFGKAIDFDRAHHPKVISGGFWLNCGWDSDRTLRGWQVRRGKWRVRRAGE